MIANAQSMEAGYKEVNGLRMYYETYGSGRPLILIHGGGSTVGTTFGRVIGELAQHARVIAVELQAHGHTPDIERPLSFEQDADDVHSLLSALSIDQADFLGFSNGGNTVIQIAIRHPEVVRKAVVCSVFFKREGIHSEVWDFIRSSSVESMPKELKEAFLAINPDPDALKVMHDRDRQRMVDFKDWNAEDIGRIQAETLLVAGDQDIVTHEHLLEMYRLIPKCRLLVLPGRHGEYLGEITIHKEGSMVPEVFTTVVNQFLR